MNMALEYLQNKVIEGDIAKLSNEELLGLILSNPRAAREIIRDFGSFKGIANQPLEKFLKYKGINDAKIIRMAAMFEITKRIVNDVVSSIRDIEHYPT